MKMSGFKLYHLPYTRSTRVLWLYHELEAAYSAHKDHPLPPMEVIELEREAFLRNRPKELKGLNPNGKVPCFVDEGKEVRIFSCFKVN